MKFSEQLGIVLTWMGSSNEGFNERFTSVELAKLYSAHLESDRPARTPDTWSQRQIDEALAGLPIRWDGGLPVYAAEWSALSSSPPPGANNTSRMYYIRDARQIVGNCVLWWCPNGAGYTCELDNAGKFTEAEAFSNRDTDVPVPCEVAEEAALRHVRCDVDAMVPYRQKPKKIVTGGGTR